MEPAPPDDDVALLAALRTPASGRAAPTFWLTRWVFLRALGFVYTIAFGIALQQIVPLIGDQGLQPASLYLTRLRAYTSFWQHPTLFWPGVSDAGLRAAAGCGLALALLLFAGIDHALITAALWVLYLSIVHIGQVFYGYGWETLLLETGFLAVFLCPVARLSSSRDTAPPPRLMFVWLAWLLFRVMFGAGLIKIRGDACWRDLSCLVYHYETQPVPHALSRIIHFAPRWFHQGGVLFNHFVELIAPWGLLLRGRLRNAAAGCTILFQVVLI
ncbi:MAG: lipase maturation factor family protein, partial [Polyangiales bacterium]